MYMCQPLGWKGVSFQGLPLSKEPSLLLSMQIPATEALQLERDFVVLHILLCLYQGTNDQGFNKELSKRNKARMKCLLLGIFLARIALNPKP